MRIDFIKMHGLGNDFVVLDARAQSIPQISSATAAALANRNTGIGCDQLIVLEPATPASDADFAMRIFNRDGGEVEACGNASRAVAILHGQAAKVETKGGVIEVEPRDNGAVVDMGVPSFDWDAIPLAYAMDTLNMPVGWEQLSDPAAVNVGNPHVVFFIGDAEAVPLDTLGPLIETDALFPERVNVNAAEITGANSLTLRVWERGAGLTRACGTGACASAVAAIRRKLVSSPVEVSLPGGVLTIAWDGQGTVAMTGPATESFRGSFEWDDFA